MNDSVKTDIATIEKTVVAEAKAKPVIQDNEMLKKITTEAVSSALQLKTSIDEKVRSVQSEMIQRIDQLDVTGLTKEVGKIKGQSEARYLENKAQIASLAADVVKQTVELMESNGLTVTSGAFWSDLKKGILVLGSGPAIRISIPQLIADAYLLRNVDVLFEVGSAPADPKMLDFFYAEGGKKSIKLRNKPYRVKASSEKSFAFKDIVSVSVTPGGAGVYCFDEMTLDEFKAAITTAAIAGLTVTYVDDSYGVNLVKFKNNHATNPLFVEYETEVSLKTTLSLKKLLIGAVAIATTKVHGAAGLGVALFGEEAVSKLMKDVQRDLPASILG